MGNKERLILTVSAVLTVAALKLGIDEGQKSIDVYGQPLNGWPTAAPLVTCTPTSNAAPDVPATVRAVLTAAAPSSTIPPTPDIAGTVSAILTSVPHPPPAATPIIIKPEIVKPEVVKPEVVKPEVIMVPQPAPTSGLNEAVIAIETVVQGRLNEKASATARAGAGTHTPTPSATIPPGYTPRSGNEEKEGAPWACFIGLGIFAGLAGLAGGALYRDRIVAVYHTIHHGLPPPP